MALPHISPKNRKEAARPRPAITMSTILSQLYLTSYRHPDTAPFGNIMLLPEAEAYQKAAQLAAAHPETTAFYRFADFANYYPRRNASEEALRSHFIQLGGQPELAHPYSFVLMESDYLAGWFSGGPAVRVPVEPLPKGQLSFTLGDSMSTFARDGVHQVLTLDGLLDMITAHGGTLADFMTHVQAKWYYIEAQVWSRDALAALFPDMF